MFADGHLSEEEIYFWVSYARTRQIAKPKGNPERRNLVTIHWDAAVGENGGLKGYSATTSCNGEARGAVNASSFDFATRKAVSEGLEVTIMISRGESRLSGFCQFDVVANA